MALKPASEIPNNFHCAASQRTIGAFMIAARRSAAVVPAIETVVVQAVKPFHQWYSTPACATPISQLIPISSPAMITSEARSERPGTKNAAPAIRTAE